VKSFPTKICSTFDLHLLDIKSGDPEIYKKVTRQPLQPTLDYATRLSALGRPMWIRYVLVAGLTDGEDNVERVAAFVGGPKERRACRDSALPSDGQRQVGKARPQVFAQGRRAPLTLY
jgi:pyruvate-formate lyase-activating enzyme